MADILFVAREGRLFLEREGERAKDLAFFCGGRGGGGRAGGARAWTPLCEVVAHAKDSEDATRRRFDGTAPAATMPLGKAIADLVSEGRGVRAQEGDGGGAKDAPIVAKEGGRARLRLPFFDTLTLPLLANPPFAAPRSSTLRAGTPGFSPPLFLLEVDLFDGEAEGGAPCLLTPLGEDDGAFRTTVFRSPSVACDLVVRGESEKRKSDAGARVLVARRGVVVEAEGVASPDPATRSEGSLLVLDFSTAEPEGEAAFSEWPPDCELQAAGARFVRRLLLSPSGIARFSASRAVLRFLARCGRWRASLGGAVDFRFPQLERLLLSLPREYLRVLDGRDAVRVACSLPDVEERGKAVARAFSPSGGATALWEERGVRGFAAFPFGKDCFARLLEEGVFERVDSVCAAGVLVPEDAVGEGRRGRERRKGRKGGGVAGEGTSRRAVVPLDATHLDFCVLLSALARFPIDASLSRAPDESPLCWGEPQLQSAKESDPLDVYRPYKAFLSEEGVRFEEDADFPPGALLTARAAIRAERVRLEDAVCDSRRRKRRTFAARFPLLYDRLLSGGQAGRSVARSVMREALARRPASEWVLEDFDLGGDLSSFGVATLLVLCVEMVMGGEARVCVSASETAAVAFLSAAPASEEEGGRGADGERREYVLFDPCSARSSLSSSICSNGQGGRRAGFDDVFPPNEEEVEKGDFVEVKARKRWHAGRVVRVVRTKGKGHYFVARMFEGGGKKRVPLLSPSWRFLFRAEEGGGAGRKASAAKRKRRRRSGAEVLLARLVDGA